MMAVGGGPRQTGTDGDGCSRPQRQRQLHQTPETGGGCRWIASDSRHGDGCRRQTETAAPDTRGRWMLTVDRIRRGDGPRQTDTDRRLYQSREAAAKASSDSRGRRWLSVDRIRLETDGGSPGDGSRRWTETDRDRLTQMERAAADLRGSDSFIRHQRWRWESVDQIRLETDGGSLGDCSRRWTETDRDRRRQTETAAPDLRGSDSCTRHQRQAGAVGGSDQTRDRRRQ